MSRAIEASLQRERIPHKVLKGHKFFERMEVRSCLSSFYSVLSPNAAMKVKDLLAYLQLVDNPNFAPAFMRAINTPPRSMGEKVIPSISYRDDTESPPVDRCRTAGRGVCPQMLTDRCCRRHILWLAHQS